MVYTFLGLIKRHLACKAHLMRIGDHLLTDFWRLQHFLTNYLLTAHEYVVWYEKASTNGGKTLAVVATPPLLEAREH